jgi:hypothetical protein
LLHLTKARIVEARSMLDLHQVVGIAELLLRVLHTLTFGHSAPAFALASSFAQMAWVQLCTRGVPSSRCCAISQLARVGLCGIIFAALPPGSRLVVLLLDRAARAFMRSSLKTAALAPTSWLELEKREP